MKPNNIHIPSKNRAEFDETPNVTMPVGSQAQSGGDGNNSQVTQSSDAIFSEESATDSSVFFHIDFPEHFWKELMDYTDKKKVRLSLANLYGKMLRRVS